MVKPRGGIARLTLLAVVTGALVGLLLPAAAQEKRFNEGHGVGHGPYGGAARGFQGGRDLAYGAPREAGYYGRVGGGAHWYNPGFGPGPGHVGWGPNYGWRAGIGGWGVAGWGWGAGWSWNGVVAIGGPVALFATPLIVFAPPPIYVAPPPIVLGIPAPPVVAAAPPPPVAAPPVASSLPLPPETLLLATAPPPIVILPPPAVIVAAAPPTLFFSPPFVAFAAFGVGGWGWGGWAWGGHGWAWHHQEASHVWQSRGWGPHSVGYVPGHAWGRGPGDGYRMSYGGPAGGRYYGGRSYAVRRENFGRR